MMPAPLETVKRLTVTDSCVGIAVNQLTKNAEQALWAAHVRAAQLLNDEPGPVSRNILNAVNQRWRQAFLDLAT